MEVFEQKFRESMVSQVALLNRITYYIVNRKGKQMRPMFIFLVAKMLSKDDALTDRAYRGAAMIELIHTATLVHDDVVDESDRRRGFFSVNALWKNKIAVLVGDFLLARGMLLPVENDDFDLLKIISVAIREMSQGELLQIEKSRLLDITEEVYFDIIRQKTASLIAACCAMGAASIRPGAPEIETFRQFGEWAGIAFQIKDDLFDYGQRKIGKPTGIDIKEQKMTLPLIFALNQASTTERRWLLNSVKNHNKDKKRVRQVIEYVRDKGGLDYARDCMMVYKDKALELLKTFPDSDYRDSLELMVNYVVEREK